MTFLTAVMNSLRYYIMKVRSGEKNDEKTGNSGKTESRHSSVIPVPASFTAGAYRLRTDCRFRRRFVSFGFFPFVDTKNKRSNSVDSISARIHRRSVSCFQIHFGLILFFSFVYIFLDQSFSLYSFFFFPEFACFLIGFFSSLALEFVFHRFILFFSSHSSFPSTLISSPKRL